MNANAVVKSYAVLTPEERFRLILAAAGRSDEAEKNRLVRADGRITLSMSDHAPYALAFDELARLTFLELLEEAALYEDAVERSLDAADLGDANDPREESDTGEGEDGTRPESTSDADDERDVEAGDEPLESRSRAVSLQERYLDLAFTAAYILRAKADGWKLFCQRLNVPHLLLWQALPGFDRLQGALAGAEKAAWRPEGFLRWLNRVRPAGKPRMTAVPVTAEFVARATEEAFRQRVQWWGG